jgi:hypothetical protein
VYRLEMDIDKIKSARVLWMVKNRETMIDLLPTMNAQKMGSDMVELVMRVRSE